MGRRWPPISGLVTPELSTPLDLKGAEEEGVAHSESGAVMEMAAWQDLRLLAEKQSQPVGTLQGGE